MSGVNKVILVGNLGADPEYKVYGADNNVLKLRIATNERFKNKAGAWEDRAEWHSVTVFGRSAEALSRFITKGMMVYVEGRLRTSSYEKDGEKRFRTEIIGETVQILSSKKDRAEPHAAVAQEARRVYSEDADVLAALGAVGGTPF